MFNEKIKVRIVKIDRRESVDNPPKIYYKVMENVGGGYWIEWIDSYSTQEQAQDAIDRLL